MLFIFLFVLQVVVVFFLSRRFHYDFSKFIYRITRSEKWTVYAIAFLFLPGTFFHEISHFLAALFLLVPVGDLQLVPKFEGSRVRMGSVSIGKADPIRGFLVGIAPLVLGLIAILLVVHFFSINRLFGLYLDLFVGSYVVFEVGNTMFLSKEDLRVIWEFVALVVFLVLVVYLLGISFPSFDVEMILSTEVLGVIEKAVYYMMIPIVIDVVLLFIFRLVRV